MPNTESRNAVDLDELASWDDTDAGEQEPAITEADIRELAVYGFDSDKQTLVGLGPVERARRSRITSEIPDSQRMPLSEPPGPFVADDDEMPPSFRKPIATWWVVAAPALLLVASGALVLREVATGAPPDRTPSHAAALPAPTPAPETPPPVAATEPEAAPPIAVSELAPAPSVPEKSSDERRLSTPVAAEPHDAVSTVAAVPALPVQLPELPAPGVVDLAKGSAARIGVLNVASNPPANVVLDGRPIGKAPRLVQVPAGAHKLVFIHPLYGRQVLSVNVTAGQTAEAAVTF